MNTYLLLRSNQESGPYSLEALLQLGLKPYDLIWVEGRSAAWRYPSELDELKAVAPAVEEQPFDRFYRREPVLPAAEHPKPVEKPKQAEMARPAEVSGNTEVYTEPETAGPVFSDYEARFLPSEKPSVPAEKPRKSVFVTLPAPRKPAASNQPAQVVAAVPLPQPTRTEPVRTPIEEPDTPTVKFAQPLDDIKAMYVQSLEERRHRRARGRLLRQYGRQAALFLGLLGAGVALGFMVLKKPAPLPAALAQQQEEIPAVTQDTVADIVADNSAAEGPEKMPPEAADQSIIRDLSAEQIRQSRVALHTPDPAQKFQEPATGTQPLAAKPKKQTATETPAAEGPYYGYEPSQHLATTGERVKASRDDSGAIPVNAGQINKKKTETETDKAEAAGIPAELNGKISVVSNDYKKVALGGIRDLRLTVTNSSDAALSKVVVQLQYLRPNEEPLKTELVNFRSVGANEASTIRLPDTNRGIKVRYKIVEVQP